MDAKQKANIGANCAKVIASLQSKDFLFSVESQNVLWDVYRFNLSGIRGQIAFLLHDDKVIIGGITDFPFGKEETIKYLNGSILPFGVA